MFRPKDTVDFIVVGAGAAGGVIAKELATAGFTVLVLEQGPRVDVDQFDHDEIATFFQNRFANDPVTQPQTFRQTETEEARPVRLRRGLARSWLTYHRLVGGGSVMFTANYSRFREIDFVERSRVGSVQGTGLADWPISYAELEPYYTKAEWELGISGAPGPFDPPRSRPYPLPPMPVKSSGVLFERGARALGLHPQPQAMAILSRAFNGRPACHHCGFCIDFGCESRSKSATLFTTIPAAEATGRCEIRPNSYVRHIPLNARGRVTGVTYFDQHKREQFHPARAVVLCCNGAETPRLLLLSTSRRFPNGLANSSGLVGKYLMFNGKAPAHGVFEHQLNEYKSVHVTRVLFDFYDSEPARGFYGGGMLDARAQGFPGRFAASGLPKDAPSWGAEYKRMLREYYPRTMTVHGHSTSLPLESNNITLDPDLKDAWGLPAIRFTYRDHPDDLATMRFLQQQATAILEAAGARRVWAPEVRESEGSVHLLGTCRMGADPRRSVVDRYHRAHDVPNLFICDGSSLVTSGRGQPTATIQALAYRAGEHIARFAKRGEI